MDTATTMLDPVIDTAALLLSELPNDSLNIIDF